MLTLSKYTALKKSPTWMFANRFREDESGATAIEYCLIVSLIFLAILGAARSFGDSTNEMYETIDTEISSAIE